MKLGWYFHRLRRMSAAELAERLIVAGRQRHWATPKHRPDELSSLNSGPRSATVALRCDQAPASSQSTRAVVAAADALLAGRWPIFHLPAAAVTDPPDWFADPLTGLTAPHGGYAFRVAHRDEAKVGNIKFVWELSRHQATTLLACAWWLTGDPAYAERAAAQLRSWWQANPFLTGVHWTSGIEVGLRLLSWTWIRALLADWPGVRALFDDNDACAAQLYHHQLYIRCFHSLGSSANNHLIAELAGLSAAAVAFPWFAESQAWAAWAADRLAQQARQQTHPDGWNREQASEYHLFVFEMLAAAALATRLAGGRLPDAVEATLQRKADAWAASLDVAGRPPRFGDGDEGRGVLLDAPQADPAAILLDVARALCGAAAWWPPDSGSVLGHVARLVAPPHAPRTATIRPGHFADAGLTILRAGEGAREVWVRCDAGPHGFLSIAAHGHADALAVELRYGGVEVLADPGTYCYHGEPPWRSYFKGTAGHNTLGVDGVDQAVAGGPFLWLTQPAATLTGYDISPGAAPRWWQASHDGYRRLADPVTHRRRVELDPVGGAVAISDWIEAAAAHEVLLSYHLGPDIELRLDGLTAHLAWAAASATLALPPELAWSAHRGEQDPPLGWYSRGFGHRMPAFVLTGRGRLAAGTTLHTRFSPSVRIAIHSPAAKVLSHE